MEHTGPGGEDRDVFIVLTKSQHFQITPTFRSSHERENSLVKEDKKEEVLRRTMVKVRYEFTTSLRSLIGVSRSQPVSTVTYENTNDKTGSQDRNQIVVP